MSNVYSEDGGPEVRHKVPGTEYDSSLTALEIYVRDRVLDDYVARKQTKPLATHIGEKWLGVIENYDRRETASGVA